MQCLINNWKEMTKLEVILQLQNKKLNKKMISVISDTPAILTWIKNLLNCKNLKSNLFKNHHYFEEVSKNQTNKNKNF